ncbi:hypothetical protein HVZ38_18965 [Citrobacter freundii]|nr:hypothetical protein BZK41_20635 [Citrobacter sp. A316]QMD50411.1 hypothetical protein HVZ40_18965 [Citrobacter freundii]QMD60218.1 hypothetical protein HVZ38_18965 [Citrobacter freundii]
MMNNIKQKQLETFWIEVLHRSKMQLSDMNIGKFHQWRAIIGDRKINRLLKLMELILCPDNNKVEIKFIIDLINNQLNGQLLFSCFRTSGRIIVKEGLKGDIYCMPVLYVIIRYLIDNSTTALSVNKEQDQDVDIKQMFISNPIKLTLSQTS